MTPGAARQGRVTMRRSCTARVAYRRCTAISLRGSAMLNALAAVSMAASASTALTVPSNLAGVWRAK